MNAGTVISLGNDLVDLSSAEPPLHARYWDRVCTEREREYAGGDPSILWSLWAAKEATFKAIRRVDASARFIPRQFEYEPNSKTVRYAKHVVSVQMKERGNCRVALAVIGGDAAYLSYFEWWAAVPPEADPSEIVRASGRRALAVQLGIEATRISFSSPVVMPIAPVLYIGGRITSHLVSFSHHGHSAMGVVFAR